MYQQAKQRATMIIVLTLEKVDKVQLVCQELTSVEHELV